MAKFDPDAFLGTAEPEQKKKRQGFDPDAFLATPAPAPRETAAQTFGRSAASAADSVLNTVTGTLDVPARALARAYYGSVQGMPLAEAEKRAVAETTSPKDVFGRAFGVTDTAGYQQAPLRQLGTAIGETVGENVIQPISSATGLPETYVGDVASMLPIPAAQPAARVAKATGRAVKSAAQVPVDVVKGAAGRATGYIAKPGETPTGYQVPSSRIPLGETFIPAKEMAELQRGMPISEGAVRPISELAPGPVLALSGGEIPVAGQAARAFGERVGETYSNPYTAAADIGSMFLTGGIPVLTAGRGALGLAQAGADAYLGRKGFTSLTPQQRDILNQGGNPFYTQPAAGPVRPQAAPAAGNVFPVEPTLPLLPYTPAGQTPMPMPGPGRRVNIEGESYNLPYQIDVSNAQTARPQPIAPVAPSPMVSQVTPEIQQATAQGIAAVDPSKQRILDMIKSANAKKAAETETTVTPVAPTALPETPVAAPVLETAPTRALTAAEIRRQLYPPRPGETPDAFEARVQEVLAQQPSAPTTTLTPSAEILAAVPDMARKTLPEIRLEVKSTGKAAITSKNNVIQLDKAVYDDLAKQYGVTLNWDELGKLSKGVADAREQVDKFVMGKIKEARGPEKRGPQQRTLAKQAYEEQQAAEQARLAAMTPEQRQAELAAQAAQEAAAEKRAKEGFSKLFPQTKTTVTPQAAGTISPALQAMLDKQKAAGKYKPPGVSEMITDSPDVFAKIKAAPWLDRSDFEQSTFMQQLGLNSGEEFIAKMKAPEGTIIRAIDKTADSEAVKYANGDGFMTRRSPDNTEQYSVMNNDGTRYEILKVGDEITEIELTKNDEIIATYEPTIFGDSQWMVTEKLPSGAGMMVYKSDIKSSKNPRTRELMAELEKTDFNSIITEQLARVEALKKGK